MEKIIFTILFSLCTFIGFAQNQEYARPLRETYDSLDRDTRLETGDHQTYTIRIFAGEWFKTEAPLKGNAIVLTDRGERFLSTDGKPADLDAEKKVVCDSVPQLEINCVRTLDSLFIKVPKVHDAKWFYVIDQTRNIKLGKYEETAFDRWISFPVNDSTRIIRVSPENHIVSFFKIANIKEIEEKIDTTINESKDTLINHTIVWNNDTIRHQQIQRESSLANGQDTGVRNGILILIIVLLVALVVFIYLKYIREGKPVKNPTPTDHGKTHSENISFDDILNELPEEYTNIKEQIKERYINDLLAKDNEIKSKNNIEQQLKTQCERLVKENKKLNDDLRESDGNYKELKEKFDEKIKTEKEKIGKDAENKIKKAEGERDKAIDAKNTIEASLKSEFAKERKALEDAKNKAADNYKQTKEKLDTTVSKLTETTGNLELAKKQINSLENAQAQFTNVLTYVPFAKDYSGKVWELIGVVEKINRSAAKLLEKESVEDPYHVMKCLAKFTKALSGIDMAQFYTDVNMITKGQMVLKDTTLATYNQTSNKEELNNSLKIYFFDSYLAKYINAAVVLNESCIGLGKLVEGLTPNDVKEFVKYRDELQQCIDQLDIEMETTHLFDKVGQKIDLRVTLIDAGFSTGDILEIDNCYVYLKGSQRPDTKIYVKAQS